MVRAFPEQDYILQKCSDLCPSPGSTPSPSAQRISPTNLSLEGVKAAGGGSGMLDTELGSRVQKSSKTMPKTPWCHWSRPISSKGNLLPWTEPGSCSPRREGEVWLEQRISTELTQPLILSPHLLAVWPHQWLSLLSLSYFFCKMGIIIALVPLPSEDDSRDQMR